MDAHERRSSSAPQRNTSISAGSHERPVSVGPGLKRARLGARASWDRGPFGHDGAVATLEEGFNQRRLRDDYPRIGFRHYGREQHAVKGHEYGLTLSPQEKTAFVAFLKTL
jgi:hypothetical protein